MSVSQIDPNYPNHEKPKSPNMTCNSLWNFVGNWFVAFNAFFRYSIVWDANSCVRIVQNGGGGGGGCTDMSLWPLQTRTYGYRI